MNKPFHLLISTILLICLSGSTSLSSQTPTASFANWKDNKKAAYTIVHDDYGSSLTSIFRTAYPLATERGIKICFGAITSACGPTEWANARTMMAKGHECVNHSHSHLCGGSQCTGVGTYGPAQFPTELGLSTQLIETNTGIRPRFFIHPYDEYSPAIIDYLTNLGYVGTRAGEWGVINTNGFSDFMHINFAAWGLNALPSELNEIVDLAIADGGYGMYEFHGIADSSYSPIPLDVYKKHLNYVKTQIDSGNIWSATATEAITYKMQCNAYIPSINYTNSTGPIIVNFNAIKKIDSSVLRTPVTLNINVKGINATYTVTQNNVVIPSVITNGIISVNIYPYKGDIKLMCTNCTPTPVAALDVSKLIAVPEVNSCLVTWRNPPIGTFNNILVVAKEASGFTTKPSAVSYTANSNYTGSGSPFEGGKVVYQGTGSSVNVTGLVTGKTYFFRVYVLRGQNWSNGVETVSSPSNNLGCLQASYFNNINLSGTPVSVRYETAINHNWGARAPNVPNIQADNFSIRWDGSFTATETGVYKFTIKTHDGVRLWINNSLLINQWKDKNNAPHTASLYLVQGTTYTLKMEYYEKNGAAMVQLGGKSPSKQSLIMLFSPNCKTLNSLQKSDLITLNGRLDKDVVALQWVANTFNKVDYYQIEKLDKQGAFTPLSIVNDNNQTTIRLYSFKDEKLSEGDNVYRIQTIFADNNIRSQYTEPLKINYIKPDNYNIFPNPAQDYMDINLSEVAGKPVDIHIFSIFGKELYSKKIESATIEPHHIDLSNFEFGPYMIQINAEGKQSITRKLIIGY